MADYTLPDLPYDYAALEPSISGRIMFGGGVTSSLGASGVAERNLNRITVILGLVWVTCIVVLGLITKFDAGI